MKKLKVENISNIKLDFFLSQNKQDVRVVLEAGESTWCDSDSNTKSMILYARKNLVKIDFLKPTDIDTNKDVLSESGLIAPQLISVTPDVDPVFTSGDILPVVPMSNPDPVFLMNIISDVPVVISDIPVAASEIVEKEKKTTKGKRRGPKKKRGPKPGMAKKKKKLAEKLAKEAGKKNDDIQNIQDKPENI